MKILFISISMLLISANVFGVSNTPYKGQHNRIIKSLSHEQVNAYLSGHGMGYAKPAELNHYPGPQHVLELARELKLSDLQIQKTKTLFSKMKKQAVKLGTQLVELEKQLDQQFADNSINADSLKNLLNEIAVIQSSLRYTHLQAHLEQRGLLNEQQIEEYDNLRGYGRGTHHDMHQGHNKHKGR